MAEIATENVPAAAQHAASQIDVAGQEFGKATAPVFGAVGESHGAGLAMGDAMGEFANNIHQIVHDVHRDIQNAVASADQRVLQIGAIIGLVVTACNSSKLSSRQG